MCDIDQLFKQNREWAAQISAQDPDFFHRLSQQQNPDFFWIGCSDSRVPANQITGLEPGEVFVHRNVANIVHHNDMNVLSSLQFAVDVLKVEHVMIVGHYDCGGVRSALSNSQYGLVDYWINSIRDLYLLHQKSLEKMDFDDQVDRMCELNVMAQVANVCRNKIVQRAWARDQKLSIHGFCYGLKDGLLKNLDVSVSSVEEVPAVYRFDPVLSQASPTED
ncbi:carbonic anhydrase [Terasakiispira papahanaumokuakeensis]|uniref:Carbonic anhydrase n=1 Tax=Terasakiispira papahanaumokuakeensis TaxID=197479 RepID=A0A1E2V8P6_9GAMM|nr:carbonate dehydratase [Terasakiispira papahanaumokuakeensis]ODC03380.1 carbonic anhydrase [Terasakiispira papahanaumokuakeensis]